MALRRLIGPDIPSPATDGLPKNLIHGSSHACLLSGKATQIRAYIDSADGLKFSLTDTSSGVPLNLLTVNNTGETTVNGWNSFSLPSVIDVIQSTVYGIALLSASNNSITYDSAETSYTKYVSSTNPYSNGLSDPLSLSANGTGLLQTQIWGYIPPTISSVNGGSDIYDGDQNVPVVGTDFVDSAGNPDVYLSPTSTWNGGSGAVQQTVTSNSDTNLEITVVQGSLTAGTVYMYVETALGQMNSTGFAVTLAESNDIDVDIAASISLPAFLSSIKEINENIISPSIEETNYDSNFSEFITIISEPLFEEIDFNSPINKSVNNDITGEFNDSYFDLTINENTNLDLDSLIVNPESLITIQEKLNLLSVNQIEEIDFNSPINEMTKNTCYTEIVEINSSLNIKELTNLNSNSEIESPEADINISLSSALIDITILANLSEFSFVSTINEKSDNIINSDFQNLSSEIDINESSNLVLDSTMESLEADININLSSMAINININAVTPEVSSSFVIDETIGSSINSVIPEIDYISDFRIFINNVINIINSELEFDGSGKSIALNALDFYIENPELFNSIKETLIAEINSKIESPQADINMTMALGIINMLIEAKTPSILTDFNITLKTTCTGIEPECIIPNFDINFLIEDENMGLIIEDGSIVPDANSYATVIYARNYALERGLDLPEDDNAVAKLLILAMDYIEAKRDDYQGVKTSYTQELQWPRDGVYLDGVEIPTDYIPKELKKAQVQLAIESYEGFELLPSSSGHLVTEEQVGPLKTKYSEKVGSNLSPVMLAVDALLKPLMKSYTTTMRTVRI